MKKIIQLSAVVVLLVLGACSSSQSLQEYYVDSAENPDFLSFDLPTSMLNLDNANLSSDQKRALASLRKLNVLAFKKSETNATSYKVEKTKVKTILKNDSYVELLKMNSPYGKATVKYLGDDDAIDEVIVYGDNNEKGFLLIRVLGTDMNPADIVQILQAVQKSDFKGDGFKKLEELLKG